MSIYKHNHVLFYFRRNPIILTYKPRLGKHRLGLGSVQNKNIFGSTFMY